jgi:hypothetical protein
MIYVPITPSSVYPTGTQLLVEHLMPKLGATSNCCSAQLSIYDSATPPNLLSSPYRFQIPDDVYQNDWDEGVDGDLDFAQAIATSAGYSPTADPS